MSASENASPTQTDITQQVLIAGEAGQGVILQGVLLAEAAVARGAWVAQSARYGAAMRGGEATADVVICSRPIDFPHADHPDYLITISQATYQRFALESTSAKVVIYDPFFVTPAEKPGLEQLGIPATDTALKRFGNVQPANLIVLSALAEVSGLVSLEDLIQAVDRQLAVRFRDANLQALALGREMALAWRRGEAEA